MMALGLRADTQSRTSASLRHTAQPFGPKINRSIPNGSRAVARRSTLIRRPQRAGSRTLLSCREDPLPGSEDAAGIVTALGLGQEGPDRAEVGAPVASVVGMEPTGYW